MYWTDLEIRVPLVYGTSLEIRPTVYGTDLEIRPTVYGTDLEIRPTAEICNQGVSLPRKVFRGDETMQPDDELCLCFHVTKRKVVNYLRIEKPKRAAQLSECYGAGTGCGWCRPFLECLFQEAVESGATVADLPTTEEYSQRRARYIRAGRGTPPNPPSIPENP